MFTQPGPLFFSLRLFLTLCLTLWALGPTHAQISASSDSTEFHRSEMTLVPDSLASRYSGEAASGFSASGTGMKGSLAYRRTLTPLNHIGEAIYQPFFADPLLRDLLRQIKGNAEWHPYRPGPGRNYHYSPNGATNNSQEAHFSAERVLSPEKTLGLRLDSQYRELWGPFPNQRSTRMEAMAAVTIRINPRQLLLVKALGIDDGWYLRTGNTVFTDRSRFVLEDINPWSSRTGGIEIISTGTVGSLSYRGYLRLLASQWANEPADSAGSGTTTDTPFIGGVLPATLPSLFAESRSFRSTAIGGEVTLKRWEVHEITLGLEGVGSRIARRQLWRPLQIPYAYDLAVKPVEYAGYLVDRLRFGETTMSFGLRYDLYDPRGAVWRDVYQTFGDSRIVQESVRQLLIQTGGESKGTRLISPSLSISYPHRRFTIHLSFGTSYRFLMLEDFSGRSTSNPVPFRDGSTTFLRPLRVTTLESGIGITVKGFLAHITAFYKDTERYTPVFGPDVLPQTLSGFSGYWGPVDAGLRRQGGITVSLVRSSHRLRRTRFNLTGRLSYLWLRNSGSGPTSDYPLQPGADLQPGDFTTFDPRLSFFWNRKHYLSSAVALRVPSGMTATAVVHLKSGTPYQRLTGPNTGLDPGQATVTRFGPWNATLDGRVDIPLHLKASRRPTLTLTMEIRNLLNRANIHAIPDPRWYEVTGQPDNPILDQRQWAYGPARSVWAGLGLEW